MESRVDVSGLTLKEKGELMYQLAEDIVTLIMSPECRARSKNNEKTAEILEVFKDNFVYHVEDLKNYAADID